MRYDRNKMLGDFLSCKEMQDRTGLTKEELGVIDFSVKTDNLVVESLKTLIICFCNDDTPSLILRKMNMQIESLVNNSME